MTMLKENYVFTMFHISERTTSRSQSAEKTVSVTICPSIPSAMTSEGYGNINKNNLN